MMLVIEMLNSAHMAKIHYAKACVGMSDAEYRALLGRHGVKSSKDLKRSQFGEVIRDFCAAGFYDRPADLMRQVEGTRMDDGERVLLEIMAVHLAALDKPWVYANGIARRKYGITSVLACNHKQLYGINGALMWMRNNAKIRKNGRKAEVIPFRG